MAQLAIKGHATKLKEVIEILEMLGGNNEYHINITECSLLYTIREVDNAIIGVYPNSNISQIFTLEEFLEKYPYKVGDKVSSKYLKNYKIEKMEWEDTNNRVIYKLQGMGWYSADELQPYKEEIVDTGCHSMPTTPPSYKLSVEQIKTIKQTIVLGNDSPDEIELVLGDNYEVKVEEGKTYVVKKQPKYPNTYEECCKVLFPSSIPLGKILTNGYNCEILKKFGELIICRDAYWKIAGDWKPNFANVDKKFIIACYYGKIYTNIATNYNRVLVFPTEEMRDAFYENFKELIEECKELL